MVLQKIKQSIPSNESYFDKISRAHDSYQQTQSLTDVMEILGVNTLSIAKERLLMYQVLDEDLLKIIKENGSISRGNLNLSNSTKLMYFPKNSQKFIFENWCEKGSSEKIRYGIRPLSLNFNKDFILYDNVPKSSRSKSKSPKILSELSQLKVEYENSKNILEAKLLAINDKIDSLDVEFNKNKIKFQIKHDLDDNEFESYLQNM